MLLQVAYVAFVSAICIARGFYPSYEVMIILVVTAFAWRASSRRYLLDFAPFVLIVLSYSCLRGLADDFSPFEVHAADLLSWERALFGGLVPAAYLQEKLQRTSVASVLNFLCPALYMTHFVVPFVLVPLVWYFKRERYWRFVVGAALLSYAGLLTYVLFPAAPPWWAYKYGLMPESVVNPGSFRFFKTFLSFSPNPVAAMPSLHAAFPTFAALAAVHLWGRKALPLAALPLGVCFSAVYLGQHYVIDLVAGVLYAWASYRVTLGATARAGS